VFIPDPVKETKSFSWRLVVIPFSVQRQKTEVKNIIANPRIITTQPMTLENRQEGH
jgi:hypothetical protein